MTYAVGDMVERVLQHSILSNWTNDLQRRRGIIIKIDKVHMSVYWLESGVTELYLHRIMKDIIKVVTQ